MYAMLCKRLRTVRAALPESGSGEGLLSANEGSHKDANGKDGQNILSPSKESAKQLD